MHQHSKGPTFDRSSPYWSKFDVEYHSVGHLYCYSKVFFFPGILEVGMLRTIFCVKIKQTILIHKVK